MFQPKKKTSLERFLCYFDYLLYVIRSKISRSNSEFINVISGISRTYSDWIKYYKITSLSNFIQNLFCPKIFFVNFDYSKCTDILTKRDCLRKAIFILCNIFIVKKQFILVFEKHFQSIRVLIHQLVLLTLSCIEKNISITRS